MFDRQTLLRNAKIIVAASGVSWLGVVAFGIWQWSLWAGPKVPVTVVGYGKWTDDGRDLYRAHFRREDDPLKTISSTEATSLPTYQVGQKVMLALDEGGRTGVPVESSQDFLVPVGVLALAAFGTTAIGLGMWVAVKWTEKQPVSDGEAAPH